MPESSGQGIGTVHGIGIGPDKISCLLGTADVPAFHIPLHMGENVEIEGLGTFYPRMITKVVDNVEEATIKNCISSITVGFRPHTKLKNAIKNAGLKEYTKAKLKSNDKEE